jgi:hypothetical protein
MKSNDRGAFPVQAASPAAEFSMVAPQLWIQAAVAVIDWYGSLFRLGLSLGRLNGGLEPREFATARSSRATEQPESPPTEQPESPPVVAVQSPPGKLLHLAAPKTSVALRRKRKAKSSTTRRSRSSKTSGAKRSRRVA